MGHGEEGWQSQRRRTSGLTFSKGMAVLGMPETEVQTQNAAPANSAEGQPTPAMPPVTAAEAPQGATVDNATNQTTPQESAPTNPAAADSPGTGLDVGQLTRSNYADQVRALAEGTITIKEDKPAGDGTGATPPEGSTPEGTQPGASDADPDDDDDDTPPAQSGKAPAMKVPLPADPQAANLQSEALRILRSNNRAGTPISLSEAERRAKLTLGIADDPAPSAAPAGTGAGTPPGQAEPPQAARTLEQIEADIRSTRAEKQEKNKNFDFDSDVDLLEKLDALAEEKRAFQHQQTQTQQTAAQQWETAKQQVAQLYPDAANPDSALNIIARHIDQQWTESGDARINKADAPLLLYQEAAKRLNVQPAKAAAAAAPSVPTSPTSQPVQRPPVASVLAGGGAGTTAPTAAGPDFGKITNPADYMAAVTKVTGASYAPTKRVI